MIPLCDEALRSCAKLFVAYSWIADLGNPVCDHRRVVLKSLARIR